MLVTLRSRMSSCFREVATVEYAILPVSRAVLTKVPIRATGSTLANTRHAGTPFPQVRERQLVPPAVIDRSGQFLRVVSGS
jgi:hypothetical protein